MFRGRFSLCVFHCHFRRFLSLLKSVVSMTAHVQGSNVLDVLKKKMRATKEESEKYKEDCEDLQRKLQVEIMRREEVRHFSFFLFLRLFRHDNLFCVDKTIRPVTLALSSSIVWLSACFFVILPSLPLEHWVTMTPVDVSGRERGRLHQPSHPALRRGHREVRGPPRDGHTETGRGLSRRGRVGTVWNLIFSTDEG